VTTSPFPFSSDGWGTDLDDTVELRAQTADLWQEFPVWKLWVHRGLSGQVALKDVGPPSWDVKVTVGSNVRDLGWFHSAAEGKAAVEQVLAELAAET
jgi:hypothetical protein